MQEVSITTVADIAVGVYQHVFNTDISLDSALDVILIGFGSDVESILVVTFLMELQAALGEPFDHIDLFEIFFNEDASPTTIRDIASKITALAI